MASRTLLNEARYRPRSPSRYDSGTVLMMSLGPAVCSHFRPCTMALASAWHVLGLALTKSALVYRQAAGMGPPNTSCVPLSVRVSLMIFTSPFCSSIVMTGSVLLMASIWPERRAASAPEHQVGDHVGRRARGRHADLLALQVLQALVARHGLVRHADRDLRRTA